MIIRAMRRDRYK